MVVEDKGSGSYTLLLTSNPITAGMNITLNISCAAGNFTVSGVMPESGNQSQVDIPGCYTGSKMSLGNNIKMNACRLTTYRLIVLPSYLFPLNILFSFL